VENTEALALFHKALREEMAAAGPEWAGRFENIM
jgi:hypothetical protein